MTTLSKLKNVAKNITNTFTNPVGQANKEIEGKKFWTAPIDKKSKTMSKLRDFGRIKESKEKIGKLLSDKHGLDLDSIVPSHSGVHVQVKDFGDSDVSKQRAANATLKAAGYENHFVVRAPQKITTGGSWNKGVSEPSKGKHGSTWTGD